MPDLSSLSDADLLRIAGEGAPTTDVRRMSDADLARLAGETAQDGTAAARAGEDELNRQFMASGGSSGKTLEEEAMARRPSLGPDMAGLEASNRRQEFQAGYEDAAARLKAEEDAAYNNSPLTAVVRPGVEYAAGADHGIDKFGKAAVGTAGGALGLPFSIAAAAVPAGVGTALGQAAMRPVQKAGEWVTQKTGSEAAGALTENAIPLVAAGLLPRLTAGRAPIAAEMARAAGPERVGAFERAPSPAPPAPLARPIGPQPTVPFEETGLTPQGAPVKGRRIAFPGPKAKPPERLPDVLAATEAADAATADRQAAFRSRQPAPESTPEPLPVEPAPEPVPVETILQRTAEEAAAPENEKALNRAIGRTQREDVAAQERGQAVAAERATAKLRAMSDADLLELASRQQPVPNARVAPQTAPEAPGSTPQPTPPETPPETPPAAPPSKPFGVGRPMGGEAGQLLVPDVGKAVQKVTAGRSYFDRLIDAVERPIAEKITRPLLKRTMGSGPLKAVGEKLTTPDEIAKEQAVGPEFARSAETRRGDVAVDYDQIARRERLIAKAQRGKSPEDVAQTTAWFRGQADLPDVYSPKEVAGLTEARSYLNETLRPKEIAAGTKSPEAQAEYPHFLKRQYEVFEGDAPRRDAVFPPRQPKPYEAAHDAWGIELKLPEQETRALVPEGETPDYLKGMRKNGDTQTLVKFDSPQARDALLAKMREVYGPKGDGLVARTFDKMTPEEEAALRPITDTAKLYGRTGREAAGRAAKGEFMRRLSEMSDEKGKYVLDPRSAEGTRATRPEDVAAGASSGYERVQGRQWGPLDGKLLRSDAKAVLEDTLGRNGKRSFGDGVMEFGRGSNAAFRVQKVVYNTALFARHVGAMLTQLRAGGVEALNPENGPRMYRWLKDTAPGGKYHEAWVRSRIGDRDVGGHTQGLHGQPRTGPWTPERVGEMIFSGGLSEGLGSKAVARGYRAGIHAMGKTLSMPYNAAKRIILASKLEAGLSFDDAVAQTRRATLSSRDIGTLTRNLANVPFVGPPFLGFRVGMARIYLNMLADHPLRFAMDRLQNNAVQAGLLAYAGIKLTEAEKEKMRNEHPGAIVYGRSPDGELDFLDGRYLDPAGDFTPRRVKIGESPVGQRIADASGVSDSPTGDLYRAAVKGEDRFGRPLNKSGTFLGGVAGAGKEYARQVMPGLTPGIGYGWDKLAAAAQGVQVSPGVQKQTLLDALLETVGAKRQTTDAAFEVKRLNTEKFLAGREAKSRASFDRRRGAEPDVEAARAAKQAVVEERDRRRAPWEVTK